MSEFVRRINMHSTSFRPVLGELTIELTERCNNNCIHCCINLPVNDEEARKREVTSEHVKDILEQAAALGCLLVRFTGGEPLLRPDFEELYLQARRLGMKALLFTNARLITESLADLFARIPPLKEIEITVYGMSRESYESVTRSPGSFEQFRRGVDMLLDRKIPFIVKGALMPQNRADMEEFDTWAKTIPWMTKPPSYSQFFDLRNRRDDEAKNALIKALRASPEEGLAVLTRDASRYRREMSEFASKFMGPKGDRLFGCGAGKKLHVDAYGTACPCMGVRAPELTLDLAEMSLAEALDRFAALREMRAASPDYLRRCARCFLKGLCEQCPGKAWTESGQIDSPVEYLCSVVHEQARYLGWLGKTERAWDVVDWRERIK